MRKILNTITAFALAIFFGVVVIYKSLLSKIDINYFLFRKNSFSRYWSYDDYKIFAPHYKKRNIFFVNNEMHFHIPYYEKYIHRICIEKTDSGYKRTYEFIDGIDTYEYSNLDTGIFYDLDSGFRSAKKTYNKLQLEKQLIPSSEIEDQVQVFKDENIYKYMVSGYMLFNDWCNSRALDLFSISDKYDYSQLSSTNTIGYVVYLEYEYRIAPEIEELVWNKIETLRCLYPGWAISASPVNIGPDHHNFEFGVVRYEVSKTKNIEISIFTKAQNIEPEQESNIDSRRITNYLQPTKDYMRDMNAYMERQKIKNGISQ